jgi:hydroxymethylpyrimidine/phosphomethylpyrimidine kinase / thiaminase
LCSGKTTITSSTTQEHTGEPATCSFSRTNAEVRTTRLLSAKSSTFEDISAAAAISLHIARESRTHVTFCNSFGITIEQLEAEPESAALGAYTRYILDVGLEGDSIKLWIAVVACLVGYGEVGLWLARESKRSKEEDKWVVTEGNPYKQWMDVYNGKEYQDAVRVGIETLESRIAKDPPSRKRYEEWSTIWETCVKLEIAFWDMAMNLSY